LHALVLAQELQIVSRLDWQRHTNLLHAMRALLGRVLDWLQNQRPKSPSSPP